MQINVSDRPAAMGAAAADRGAAVIREALARRGEANIIVATGASQFEMFKRLVTLDEIDWSRVSVFHLDEYVGLPITHPASFVRYLWQRFISQLPVPVRGFHAIDGTADAHAEARRVGDLIAHTPIDACFCGIGENAHLAFNDPPANFDTNAPYLVVELDEACRRQQQGEGWFPTLDDVPTRAISMSVQRIMASDAIVCTVPDERKAQAVRKAVEGPVTPDVPASILQHHANCTLFLDNTAASKLSGAPA